MSSRQLHLGIDDIKKHSFAVHMHVGSFTTEVHLHSSHHQLLYAEGGVLHFFTRDQRFILPARHAAWIPASLYHRVESPSPQLYWRNLYIGRSDHAYGFPDELTIFPMTPLAREMIVYTQRWHYENPVTQPEEVFFNAICHLIPDWCSAAIRLVLPTTEHESLKNVISYIIDNLDRNLTLAKVGGEFGVSPRTLIRLFRNELDMTFQEYLRTARIIAALELLSVPDVTITEVSLQVGYQSMSSFSQAFKAIVGKSPSAFRNEVRLSED